METKELEKITESITEIWKTVLEIDITDVFEHDTVNQLSELIMEKMDS